MEIYLHKKKKISQKVFVESVNEKVANVVVGWFTQLRSILICDNVWHALQLYSCHYKKRRVQVPSPVAQRQAVFILHSVHQCPAPCTLLRRKSVVRSEHNWQHLPRRMRIMQMPRRFFATFCSCNGFTSL